MDFFKNVTGALLSAKDYVVEKNRKTALINRLRMVIKGEEQNAERAYLALGRYYYHNLRDSANAITEPHCAEIDATERRLEQAVAHLEKMYSEDSRGAVIEQIDLADVTELKEPAPEAEEDAVTEDIVDEAVGAATSATEGAATSATEGAATSATEGAATSATEGAATSATEGAAAASPTGDTDEQELPFEG